MQQEPDEKAGKSKRKGCFGWLWRIGVVGLLLLVGVLVWLNGPGIRWLGPKVAERFLEKAGIEGDFNIVGSVSGGLGVEDLRLTSDRGVIKDVGIGSLKTDYRLSELTKGKIRGIKGKDIRAEIRLGAKEEEEKPPFDFQELGDTLRKLREQVMPVNMDLENVSLYAEDEVSGERVVGVASTDLKHVGGTDTINLSLGEVMIGEDQTIPAQEAELVWTDERLSLDALRLLPILAIENLEVDLPQEGEIAGRVDISLAEAKLKADVGAGLRDVRLDMVEGEIDFADVMEGLSLELPLEGRLTSLSVGLEQVFPEWQNAIGSAELMVEGVVYDGWSVPEGTAGVVLDEGEIGLQVKGEGVGTSFEIDGAGEFERSKLADEGLQMNVIEGDLAVGEVDQLLGALNEKLGLEMEVAEFPASGLEGSWKVELEEMAFEAGSVDVALKADDSEIAPILLAAGFSEGVVDVRDLSTLGLKARAQYGLEEKDYGGQVALEEFDTRSIAPWLSGLGIELPGEGIFSLKWKGQGELEEAKHSGEIDGLAANWRWNEVEGEATRGPIEARGDVDYAWPQRARVDNFVVETEGQRIALNAALLEDSLALEELRWSEGETELLEGAGVLPVPKDFSKWREFISEDTRPLKLAVKSKELSLQKLSPWVPAVEQIEEGATGKMDLLVTGSLAEPEILLDLDLANFALKDKEDIPSADLTFNMQASGGIAKMKAELLTKDYAPATLEAQADFFPTKWVDEPELVKQAAIQGRVDLPKVNVAQFEAFLPEGGAGGGESGWFCRCGRNHRGARD